MVLVVGALAATMLGALSALQFDRLVTVGQRLMLPVGQAALLKAVMTLGLAGCLGWLACALMVRTVRGVALRPYDMLADRLERIADGEIDTLGDLHGPGVGVRRLARTVIAFQERALASRRSEANLQVLYDAICREQAEERRLLMGMLTRGGLPPLTDRPAPSPSQPPADDLEIPVWSGTGKITEKVTIDLTGQSGSTLGSSDGWRDEVDWPASDPTNPLTRPH